MKKDIHPEYREVLFHDISVDEYFLLRSTLKTDKTKEWEGKEYPYYTVEVSSASHPFYTGKQKIIDTYTGKVPDIGKMFLSGSLEQKQAIQVVVASAYAQGAQEAVKNQIGAGLAKQIIELDSGLQLFDVSVFIDTSIAKAEMLLDGFNELYDRMMSRLNKIADPNQRQLNAALYKKIFLGFLTKSGLDEAESMPFLENFTTVAHLADYNPATYGLKSPVNDPASPPSSVIIFPEEKDQVEDDIEEDISDAEYVDIEAREERLAEK